MKDYLLFFWEVRGQVFILVWLLLVQVDFNVVIIFLFQYYDFRCDLLYFVFVVRLVVIYIVYIQNIYYELDLNIRSWIFLLFDVIFIKYILFCDFFFLRSLFIEFFFYIQSLYFGMFRRWYFVSFGYFFFLRKGLQCLFSIFLGRGYLSYYGNFIVVLFSRNIWQVIFGILRFLGGILKEVNQD